MPFQDHIESILEYLADCQTPAGEFRSQCYLPTAEQPQWYYSGASPFLTANIAWCLHGIEHPLARTLLERSLDFLYGLQEKHGLWRYWEHDSSIMEYNVPNDLDDTCLVSWLLRENGRPYPDNGDLIRRNIRPDGNIDTWFLARKRNLGRFAAWRYLLGELWKSRGIFLPNKNIPNREPISSIHDAEAAVECHALLYLGKTSQTARTLQKIIQEGQNGTFALQYYDRPHFVFYHISRLIPHGFKEFEVLRPQVDALLKQAESATPTEEDHLGTVMNALTLLNFGWKEHPALPALMEKLATDPMVKGNDWRPYKYWTSKQRSWWAGSPELTAALYLEAFWLAEEGKNENVRADV
jgi:hypothetical protein